MYEEDVGVREAQGETQEVYEDPDSAPKPPEPAAQIPPPLPPPVTKPPPSKSGSALPPLPPTPVPQKPTEPVPPEPQLIEEEMYEDASSVIQPSPPPPPVRGAPSIPLPSEPLSQRRLPPTPVEPPKKKKIKLNITCKPDEDFENKYFGKWECKGDSPNELSFHKGDIIYILSKEFDEKSWWIGELNGKFGLVPKTFLTPAYTSVS